MTGEHPRITREKCKPPGNSRGWCREGCTEHWAAPRDALTRKALLPRARAETVGVNAHAISCRSWHRVCELEVFAERGCLWNGVRTLR